MRTQVGIVGAGPAGLMLSHLLAREGIDSIIVENQSRAYVEARIRAGVIENWAADLLVETGVGARMQREGLVHEGIEIALNGERRRIDFKRLTGRGIMVYGQHEVVKDLIAARLAAGGRSNSRSPRRACTISTEARRRSATRKTARRGKSSATSSPAATAFTASAGRAFRKGVLTEYERIYPFGWLGILSQSPPPSPELIYSYTERGFGLYSMRSPTVSRLYLQCAPDEDLGKWPDDKSLEGAESPPRTRRRQAVARRQGAGKKRHRDAELRRRADAGGKIVSRRAMPPTSCRRPGAKGMNLAIADVLFFSRALAEFYRSGKTALLDGYTQKCLSRVWKAQRFSWWMTSMLHLNPTDSPFDRRRQFAELDYVTTSEAASKSLAENYVGLPID